MRLLALVMCALLAAGVFIAMFIAILNTRHSLGRLPAFRQGLATELMWAAIPCLMVLAAAIPAVIEIASAHGD